MTINKKKPPDEVLPEDAPSVEDEAFGTVRELIRRESGEAVTRFRRRDFDARIRARIDEETSKSTRRPAWLRPASWLSPTPVLVAALLLIAVSVPVILHLSAPSAEDKEFRQLQNYFAHIPTPGDEEETATPAPARPPEFIALEQTFKRGLYAAAIRNENISGPRLPEIFNKVLFNAPLPEEENTGLSSETPPSPDPGRLEKRIRTMMKEKQLQRVFRVLRKGKEV